MKFLGNIIWLLFGGLFLALGYLFTGLGLCLTIIGIPFGIQVFKLAGLALWPFGKEVRYKKQTTGCLNTGMNLLWILIGGIWLALGHAITGLVYCITIIGIPFGKQHFKLAAIILTPFGREVVSSNKVKKEQAAIEEPAIPALEETPVIENAPEPLAEAAEPQVKESLLQESDKPTEEQTLAIEQQVEEPMSTLPMEEESTNSSPANEEKDVVDEDVNLSEKEEDNKKKYFIVGGVLLAALVAGGTFMLFHGNSDDELFGNTDGIIMPKFQKFVVASSYAYASPSTSAPRLMECYDPDEEGGESDGSWIEWEGQSRGDYNTTIDPLVPGLVPVMDEQDGWYKVWYSGSRWGGSAYRGIVWVEKGNSKDVKLVNPPFEPSPKADKYKDYKYEVDDGGGDLVPILIRHTEKCNIELHVTDWQQAYELHSRLGNYWEGLTDKEFEQLIPYFSKKAVAIEVKTEDANGNSYNGYFFVDGVDEATEPSVIVQSQLEPEAEEEGPKTVLGYYVEDSGGMQQLMAQYGLTTGYTGFTLIGPLVGTADFDGDGNMDALVQNGYPGSSGVYYFKVVYFDGQAQAFKESDDEIGTYSDSPAIEDWNGRKTIAVREGLNTKRYAFEAGQVKMVENTTATVGSIMKRVTKNELFPQQEGEHTDIFYTDLDDDGLNEEITFFTGDGHPYNWGTLMSIESISYAVGNFVSKDALRDVNYGAEFAFLYTKTNGLPDILVDGSHYFRWSGYKYQEWIWDGSQFVVEN